MIIAGQITGPGGLTVTGGPASNTSAIATVTAGYLLVLDASNNNYQGITTINNATVTDDDHVVGGTAVNILPQTTVLALSNSAVFAYYGGNSVQTLAGLSGDNTTAIGTENNSSPTYLTINPAAGQTYTYAGVIGDINVNGRGHAGTGGAPLNVTFSGLGTEVLSGTKLDTGTTTVTSGTVALANVNVLPNGITANNAGTVELLSVNALGNGVLTDNAASNGLAFAAGNAIYTIGGLTGSGNISLTAQDTNPAGLNINAASGSSATYSGALSGAGSLSNARGTLFLTNSNTSFTGPITVTGGALFLNNTGVLPSAWQNPGTISVANGGTFGVTAGTNAATGEFSLAAITGSILSNVNFAASASLGLNIVDTSPLVFPNLTDSPNGSLGLLKLGSGTLQLDQASISGPTTIAAGVLTTSTTALQNSNLTDNGGLLFDSGAGTYSLAGLAGSGSLTLTATNGSAMTLSFGSNGVSNLFSGTISGGSLGSLIKLGGGNETLSGSANYTNTTVSGGTLTLIGAAYSGSSSTANKAYSIAAGSVLSLSLSSLNNADNAANSEPPSSSFTGAGTLNIASGWLGAAPTKEAWSRCP